jgi:predicted regulator of Ras-like GTPase activity (Roadblock/LC7/MglB family)
MSYKNATLPPQQEGATLSSLVKRICRANPAAPVAFVVDSKGNVHCPDGLHASALRAAMGLALPLRELAERTAADMGCGAFQHMLLSGSAGTLAMADVDGDRTAVVLAPAEAAAGALRADAIWLARSLREQD